MIITVLNDNDDETDTETDTSDSETDSESDHDKDNENRSVRLIVHGAVLPMLGSPHPFVPSRFHSPHFVRGNDAKLIT